jgi:NADPH-dependent 2,4-dienoyl-CoA reductase/sulfur reductase-like enzyme
MSIENNKPSTSNVARRPKVVVVGAGFGGLEAAKALVRAPVNVTVIDRRNFHLFQPLLYQVATAVLPPSEIAWPIRSVFAGRSNVEVVMLEIDRIDIEGGFVAGGAVTISFDYLVVATGATHACSDASRKMGARIKIVKSHLGLYAGRLRTTNSERFSHFDQIGQRPRAHFFHDVPTVELHGNLGKSKLGCCLFVHEAR